MREKSSDTGPLSGSARAARPAEERPFRSRDHRCERLARDASKRENVDGAEKPAGRVRDEAAVLAG